MHYIFRALIIVAILLTTAHAAEPQIKSAQLKADLNQLHQQLKIHHPGLYRYTGKTRMDQLFTDADKALNKPMDVSEFYKIVAPVVAQINCGHTRLQLPQGFIQSLMAQRKLFPLALQWIDREAYVRQPLGTESKIQKGDKILSINGKKMKDITAQMLAAVSSDGHNKTSKYHKLNQFFNMTYLVRNFAEADKYNVEYQSFVDGKTRQTVLDGLTFEQVRQNADSTTKPRPVLDLAITDNIATLTIRTFDSGALNRFGLDFEQFLQSSFKELKQQKVKNLIIDVRGNGGGDDNYGALLVSYIAKQPFDYFKAIKVNSSYSGYGNTKVIDGQKYYTGHSQLSTQPVAKNTFDGKVYVLIDGGSFSTTADFAAIAKHNKLALIIGEESGGGFYGNTSGWSKRVRLDNSGLSINVPRWGYYNAVDATEPPGRGVMPDHAVHETVQTLLADIDLAMEFALDLIKTRPNTSTQKF